MDQTSTQYIWRLPARLAHGNTYNGATLKPHRQGQIPESKRDSRHGVDYYAVQDAWLATFHATARLRKRTSIMAVERRPSLYHSVRNARRQRFSVGARRPAKRPASPATQSTSEPRCRNSRRTMLRVRQMSAAIDEPVQASDYEAAADNRRKKTCIKWADSLRVGEH